MRFLLILPFILSSSFVTAQNELSSDKYDDPNTYLMLVYELASKKGNLSDEELDFLSKTYASSKEGSFRYATSLGIMENGLRKKILKNGIGGRFNIPEFPVTQSSKRNLPVWITLKGKDGRQANTVLMKLQALGDQYPAPFDGSSLPNSSVIRFSGALPFPFSTKPNSLLDGNTLVWKDPEINSGITNEAILRISPDESAMIIKGDMNAPLTFVFLDGLGMIYMHGVGSIALDDGRVVNLPK